MVDLELVESLNESPSEKEGKSWFSTSMRRRVCFSLNESPSEKEGKFFIFKVTQAGYVCLNESPSEKEGKSARYRVHRAAATGLNESPSEKEGKCVRQRSLGDRLRLASMKVPPKRKGNSYPKIARNHAAETGASREPRGGYTQNYTLQPHLPPHNSLAREETMRATRHVPVTYQVLAHTKTPAGCFLSDPARVLTYERGWRGSGKPD